MIFLKKIFSTFLISALAGTCLCGCSSFTAVVPSMTFPDITEETTSVPDGQDGEVSDEPIINVQENTFIYDNVGTLTATEFDECNKYAEMLYSDYLLNTAVVITDDLKGFTVDRYASEVYRTLYGDGGCGMVFVINNAENQDLLYKIGHCQRFIDDISERDELYKATTELVVENYKEAVMIMLKLAEKCPKNLIDNSNVFAEEVSKKFSEAIEELSEPLTIVALDNNTSATNDELAEKYALRRGKNGYTAIIDQRSKTVAMHYDGGELPAEKADIASEASASASAGDFIGAVNKLITGFGGEEVSLSDSEEDTEEYEEETEAEETEDYETEADDTQAEDE